MTTKGPETMHQTTITTKAASGNGDIGGYAVRCSCGDYATWSLEIMAKQYAHDHVAYMTAKEAKA